MTKRYVYWRAPTGRPHRTDDGRYAPSNLLAEIGKTATINDKGNVSWASFLPVRFEIAIRPVFVVLGPDGRELNETDTWAIAWQAIINVIKRLGGAKPVIPSETVREADKLAAEYFRALPSAYILVSSLSVEDFPATQICLRGCEISPLKSRGSRFPLPERLAIGCDDSAVGRHVESTAYQTVKVKVEGRSIYEAAGNALESLNILRGLWTLFATFQAWSYSFGTGRMKPIGVVHTGPIHTLHRPDGTLIPDIFWYEPGYTSDHTLFKPENGWERIEKNRRWTMRHLRQLAYREDLETLIARYAAALDHSDLDVAFLQMWSILERLTDTVGGNYNDSIRSRR